MILFLQFSQELRDFCGMEVVTDPSKFTRFKLDFLPDLLEMFDLLVNITEPTCQKIDLDKASRVLFDASGIEAGLTDNNPQYTNNIAKQLKV